MSTMVKKGSVKLLVVACVLACLIGIIMPLSASASNLGIGGLFEFVIFDSYSANGASDITTTEAMFVLSEYLRTTPDVVDYHFDFQVVEDRKVVEVYEDGALVEVIYKDSSGAYKGYSSGFSITIENGTMEDIVTTVSVGVKGVFDMAAEAFLFLTSNDICMFMIAVTFGGIALAFVGRSFKTARK